MKDKYVDNLTPESKKCVSKNLCLVDVWNKLLEKRIVKKNNKL